MTIQALEDLLQEIRDDRTEDDTVEGIIDKVDFISLSCSKTDLTGPFYEFH